MGEFMKPDLKIVEKAVSELGEHYDAVQIFCVSRGENGISYGTQSGCGSYYERLGIIHEWIVKCDEETRINARNEHDS